MISSSIARKALMALTGLALLGFVIAHLAGNLQVFLGPEVFNAYGKKLEDFGPVLWIARLTLLAIFLIHIYLGAVLSAENRAARPVPYFRERTVKATPASRTMMLTGLLILAFVIFHLAHFTFRVIFFDQTPEVQLHGAQARDIYRMLVLGFQRWYVVAAYLVAQVFLAMHLSHGASSMFQTLGIEHPKYDPVIRRIGPVLAGLIFIGYVSIPTAVLAGIVTLPTP